LLLRLWWIALPPTDGCAVTTTPRRCGPAHDGWSNGVVCIDSELLSLLVVVASLSASRLRKAAAPSTSDDALLRSWCTGIEDDESRCDKWTASRGMSLGALLLRARGPGLMPPYILHTPLKAERAGGSW
jgi:hypothetical protein